MNVRSVSCRMRFVINKSNEEQPQHPCQVIARVIIIIINMKHVSLPPVTPVVFVEKCPDRHKMALRSERSFPGSGV